MMTEPRWLWFSSSASEGIDISVWLLSETTGLHRAGSTIPTLTLFSECPEKDDSRCIVHSGSSFVVRTSSALIMVTMDGVQDVDSSPVEMKIVWEGLCSQLAGNLESTGAVWVGEEELLGVDAKGTVRVLGLVPPSAVAVRTLGNDVYALCEEGSIMKCLLSSEDEEGECSDVAAIDPIPRCLYQ